MSRFSVVASTAAAILLAIAPISGAHAQDNAVSVAPGTTGTDYTYISPQFASSRFSSVCLPPVTVYQGADAQFGNIPEADRQRFASILSAAVMEEMSKSFVVSNVRRPGCLNIQLSLVGVQDTTGGVATATRVLPIGLAFNTIRQLQGKQGGTFTGSMTVSVEMTGKNDDLLVAATRRRAPEPLDVGATLSTTDTVRAVSKELARSLRDRLIGTNVVALR